jgi:HAE1 family hydrophobic/amphiphilic exporter-1
MAAQIRDNPLVRTALVRPISMLMLLASVLVIGTVAVLNIPLELIPSGFSAPVMTIEVPYSNANAQDVEERITRPLEQALSTTPAMDEISATSTANQARITLVFEGDADMDLAYREVRDRIDRARPDLPDDVQQVRVQKHSGDGIPVAFYGVAWPENLDAAPDLIERHLVRQLERVDGVGMVRAWGGEEREIRIEIDRALAEAARLNIFEIAQRLTRSHFNLASGALREADGKLLVRSMAEYGSVAELENVVVGPNGLRLRDVAAVRYEYPDVERYDRYNGQPTMAIFVIKESQANTVEVCDRIKEAVEEARRNPALSQIGIEPIFLQGDTIRASLTQVTDSGLQGGVLAIVVLLFFLRRLRLTIVIALSIPLSMFMSLPFMYFGGQSINLVSLIGLMICIGLVVDNAVVVAENVMRYRQRGLERFAAALHGTSEIALPVTLATATTMVVFLPVALLSSGMTRFFMIRMVTPVCVSLLASLFVALILVPLAVAYVLDRDPFARARPGSWWARIGELDRRWKAVLDRVYERTVGRTSRGYGRLLRWSIRRRIDVVMIGLLSLGSLAIPAQEVEFVKEQNMGGRQIRIAYTIPSHVSLEQADTFFRELEAWFAEHRAERNANGEYIQIEPGYAQISIFFGPPRSGDRPYREVGKEIFEAMPVPPGWTKRSDLGTSDGAQEATFPIVLYGEDHETVQAAKDELERALVSLEGVVTVAGAERDTSRRDELALSVDRVMSERLGVSAGMVANTVAYALRGSPLPRFRAADREIDVWIRYRKEDREELRDLLQFKVPTADGSPVAIETLTAAHVERGESVLVRNNKRVAALIRLELDAEQREDTVGRLRAFLAGYRLPDGVSFDADDEQREVDDQKRDLAYAAILGSVFIFLLMGFLFESFVLPLSVMPSIPLAFVGVWWFLYLTGENVDGLAVVGILLLLGVVVNNAIVLVDFVNNARAVGLSRVDAIVQAGVQRFRPIMMTALTTVGGMLPLAFADAPAEGIPYGAFGKTLVGGMTTATVLTLVVVPVFYTLFDDLREQVRRWFGRVLGPRR